MKLNSISIRLTVWYALLSTTLIASVGYTMYWMLADRLLREDDTFLLSKVSEARAVIALHPENYDALQEELQHEGETFPDIRVRVLDEHHAVIADTNNENTHGIASEIFDAMPWTTEKTDWYDRQHTRYRLMQQHSGKLTIHAAMRLAKEQRLLNFYRDMLLTGVAAVLLIAMLAGYAIARYGLAPLHRLAALVDGLSVKQLNQRVGETDWPQELRLLADNFNRLLIRLDDAFSRMSRFSADIAHELRTPLQILRSEAEMSLSRERSPAEYRQCLESGLDEYARLSRMVDALLFLARAEQADTALDYKNLDLSAELQSVCHFFQAMADELDITLHMQAHGHLSADQGLLRRALANLVDNALRHTGRGGTVTLNALVLQDGDVELSVSDSGCGIANEDLPHITERFYTADRSRQRLGQGSGLGLAIVQSIMRLHGGTITFSSTPGQGTEVKLQFPANDLSRHSASA